jgi:hypothetical protein
MARVPNLTYTCQQCGKAVSRYVRPYRIEQHGLPKYCSQTCTKEAQYRQPRAGSKYVDLSCAQCGKEFTRTSSMAKKGNNYCSPECLHRAKTFPANSRRLDSLGYWHVRVDKHPHARYGGLWILEHRLVKERQLLRDDPDSEFLRDGYLDPDCHVHHKNQMRDDNREENLQAMWPSDHHKGHKGYFKVDGNSETHKRCSICKEVKERTEYGKNRASYNGINHFCKACNRKRMIDYRQKKKEQTSV